MAWADGPFSTPAEAVEAMDRLNQRAVAEAEAAAGPVLVVDDDNSIVDMLILALGCRGYQVLSAEGASALQLAAEHHPAVVLLDLTMPGMGGAEIGRRLRDDPRTADIPIVMMSARDHLDSAWATVPADDHLAKPFNLSRLYETVARWAGPA
jgi:CheY-like chemotaxis protein